MDNSNTPTGLSPSGSLGDTSAGSVHTVSSLKSAWSGTTATAGGAAAGGAFSLFPRSISSSSSLGGQAGDSDLDQIDMTPQKEARPSPAPAVPTNTSAAQTLFRPSTSPPRAVKASPTKTMSPERLAIGAKFDAIRLPPPSPTRRKAKATVDRDRGRSSPTGLDELLDSSVTELMRVEPSFRMDDSLSISRVHVPGRARADDSTVELNLTCTSNILDESSLMLRNVSFDDSSSDESEEEGFPVQVAPIKRASLASSTSSTSTVTTKEEKPAPAPASSAPVPSAVKTGLRQPRASALPTTSRLVAPRKSSAAATPARPTATAVPSTPGASTVAATPVRPTAATRPRPSVSATPRAQARPTSTTSAIARPRASIPAAVPSTPSRPSTTTTRPRPSMTPRAATATAAPVAPEATPRARRKSVATARPPVSGSVSRRESLASGRLPPPLAARPASPPLGGMQRSTSEKALATPRAKVPARPRMSLAPIQPTTMPGASAGTAKSKIPAPLGRPRPRASGIPVPRPA